jgi:hypothetical protein
VENQNLIGPGEYIFQTKKVVIINSEIKAFYKSTLSLYDQKILETDT